jgi:hypothetical protein
LIGNASGQNVEGKKLLRGIFDKETRRKAVAVADAAMEPRARFGPVEPMEWSGNDRRELVLSEIGIRRMGNFATCMQAELRDRAVVLR